MAGSEGGLRGQVLTILPLWPLGAFEMQVIRVQSRCLSLTSQILVAQQSTHYTRHYYIVAHTTMEEEEGRMDPAPLQAGLRSAKRKRGTKASIVHTFGSTHPLQSSDKKIPLNCHQLVFLTMICPSQDCLAMYNGCPAVGSYVLLHACTYHLGIEKKNFFKGGGQPLLLIHQILYQDNPYSFKKIKKKFYLISSSSLSCLMTPPYHPNPLIRTAVLKNESA